MFSSPRNALLFALLLALVAGYSVVGHYLDKIPIGLNNAGFLAGEALAEAGRRLTGGRDYAASGAVLLVLSLLAIGAAAFFAVRHGVRRRLAFVDPGRRRFLTGAGSGLGAALVSIVVAGLAGAARGVFGIGRNGSGWKPVYDEVFANNVVETHPEWKESWKGSRIRAHRLLGRTGWRVSDIVLGTGGISGDAGELIGRQVIERGVNYFDTSPDYSGAGSEQAMGRVIAGVRDQLFIATKFCTPSGHLPAGSSVASYVEAVEGSLRRLGTDYVDLCHIHSCDTVARLMDEGVHEAFDRLKQAGKVRFLGFSSHTPNLVEVANTAIDSGRFDVMMLAYHHGLWAPLPGIIERARRQQDMGVVAMKTLKGARHHGLEGFRDRADAFSQAALRWVLSNPDVSCAVISFYELQHVDEYLAASGGSLTAGDRALLEEYDRRVAGTYCPPHCGACLDSCPEQLPIHDVLRYRMYAEDYGWKAEGERLYALLERGAERCAGCPAPCLGSCPVGIPIQERMGGAHRLLTSS